MAVRLEGTVKRYVGESTDDKPRPGTHPYATLTHQDLTPGSSFMEADTGRIYRWDGTEWKYGKQDDDSAIVLSAILCELRALRETVELVTA